MNSQHTHHDGGGDDQFDDAVERASEIEDFTDGIERPVGEGSDDAGADAATADVDVAALIAERDSYRDLAQRGQAEFENYRKRAIAQQQSEVDRATGKMAEGLLVVLDACEAAFLQHPAEVEPLFNQLLVEMRKLGLESMDLDGKPFDPNMAEAVLHEPGDGGEPIVTEVLRSGYLWKGRVLRAAMVKVRG